MDPDDSRPKPLPRKPVALAVRRSLDLLVALIDRAVDLVVAPIVVAFVLPFRLIWSSASKSQLSTSQLAASFQNSDDVLWELELARTGAEEALRSRNYDVLTSLVLHLSGRGDQTILLPTLEHLARTALRDPTIDALRRSRDVQIDVLLSGIVQKTQQRFPDIDARLSETESRARGIGPAFMPVYREIDAFLKAQSPLTIVGRIGLYSSRVFSVIGPLLMLSPLAHFAYDRNVANAPGVSVGTLALEIAVAYVALFAIAMVLAQLARIRMAQHATFMRNRWQVIESRRDTAKAELARFSEYRNALVREVRDDFMIPTLRAELLALPVTTRPADALPPPAQAPAQIDGQRTDSRSQRVQTSGELSTAAVKAIPRMLREDVSADDRGVRLLGRSRVFLCHGSEDKPVVREFYDEFKSRGIDAWFDEIDLVPGHDWRREIQAAIRQSAVVVIFLSRQSTHKRGFVQKEIAIALDAADEQPEGTIFLIPAKIDDCDVPDRLAKWQWVSLAGPRGLERLLAAIRMATKT